MKETSAMVKEKGMENTLGIKKRWNMTESGKLINGMASDDRLGPISQIFKGIGSKVKYQRSVYLA